MFNRFTITSLSVAALLLAAPAMAGPGHDDAHEHTAPAFRITPITPKQLEAGKPNEVLLYIQDEKAKPVDISEFEVVHTKPVHLLIIEPGLGDYHHEHPIQTSKGQYAFSFSPQTACSYRIWADVKRKGDHQHYVPIDIKGAEACDVPIEKTTNFDVTAQGYDFKLELESDLSVGSAVLATLRISKDGQPVDFLEPVMGAFAHMVGFYEDYESIAHIHPMGKEPTEDSQRGGPALQFHINPDKPGYLKLFAQVQIDGKQVFAPFGMMIDGASQEAAHDHGDGKHAH